MGIPVPAVYPVLYSFRRCPYAMRARMALAVSGQVCELREVILSRKPAEMLQASPKGTVPVLVRPNGSVIDQSLDIMLWALRSHDPEAWLPATADAMAHTLRMVAECDGPFKSDLDRYKYPNRYALPNGTAHRDHGSVFLMQLELQLAEKAGIAGTHFGLADAAIAPFVRQFAHTDASWFAAQPWPALQRWLATFEASALFAQVMDKHPTWTAGDAPCMFPAGGATQVPVL